MKFHIHAALAAAAVASLPLAAHAQSAQLNSEAAAQSAVYSTGTHVLYPGGNSQQSATDGAPVGAAAASGMITETLDTIDPGCQCYVPLKWQVETSATGSASATFGSLHATATAAYQLLPYTQTFEGYLEDGTPYVKTLPSPYYLRATAGAEAAIYDYFTVTSSTLAAGTTVQANFSAQIDASLDGGGKIDVDLYAYDQATYDVTPGVHFEQTTPGAVSTTQSGLQSLVVGDTYALTADLGVFAEVPGGACDAPSRGTYDDYGYTLDALGCGQQSFAVNAGDTAKFFISPDGSNYALSFSSGYDYAPPDSPTGAPEPAGWAMMITGLTILGASLRRRRQALGLAAA
jgi:hypothetical protein